MGNISTFNINLLNDSFLGLVQGPCVQILTSRLLSGSTSTNYQNTFVLSQRCLRIGRVGFHTHMAHLQSLLFMKKPLPTKNKPKREEGAGLFERENSFLFYEIMV